MPLEVFIAAKIKGLATDASELFVDADSSLRACLYPGSVMPLREHPIRSDGMIVGTRARRARRRACGHDVRSGGPGCRSAHRYRLALADLVDIPLPPSQSSLAGGALTARQFEQERLPFLPVIEVNQYSAACAFAERGLGVAILDSMSGLYARRHGLRVVPVDVEGGLDLAIIWPLTVAWGAWRGSWSPAWCTSCRTRRSRRAWALFKRGTARCSLCRPRGSC